MSAIDRVRRLADSLSQKPQPVPTSVTEDVRRLCAEWNTLEGAEEYDTAVWNHQRRKFLEYGSQEFGTWLIGGAAQYWSAIWRLHLLVLSRDAQPPLGTGSHGIQIGQVILPPEAIPRLFPLDNDPSEDATRLFADTDAAIREALPLSENSSGALLAFALFGYPEDIASMRIEVVTLGGIKKNELNLEGDSKRLVLERAGSLSMGSSGPVADPLAEIQRMRALTMLSVPRGGVDDSEGYNLRQRKRMLENTNLSRGRPRPPPLVPGTSISAGGMVAKGSFGVFLQPVRRHEGTAAIFPGINPNNFYAITACHVVNETPLPANQVVGGRVVSPGGLDVLARMHLLLADYALETSSTKRTSMLAQLKELEEQFNMARVGTQLLGKLGADLPGWREDWALFQVDPQWSVNTDNDVWWSAMAIREKMQLLGLSISAPLKVAAVRDPLPGERVFKDGATTHVTGGIVDRTQVLAYLKRTIIAAEQPAESTTAIDVCEHRLVWPLDDEEHMVQAGDSGSAVLAAGATGTGLDFVGMFVTLWTEEQNVAGDTRRLPRTLGMMVPQSILLKQIAEATGWEWTIT